MVRKMMLTVLSWWRGGNAVMEAAMVTGGCGVGVGDWSDVCDDDDEDGGGGGGCRGVVAKKKGGGCGGMVVGRGWRRQVESSRKNGDDVEMV
ncbi:hypothetical protein Tco_0834798 [Tanacetum coccineum]